MPEELKEARTGSDYYSESVAQDSAPSVPIPTRRLSWATAFVTNQWKRLAKLAVPGIIALALYQYVSAPDSVNVAVVKTVTTAETIGATGKIRGSRVADLGLDSSGVIKSIYVKEGDSVTAGQPLLALAQPELRSSAEAARAALESANAELARASRGPLPSEIREARAQLAQAQSVGQARINQAEAKLRTVKRGSRPQEVAEAQSELQRRQDILAKAELDYGRLQKLYKQGAISESQLDDAKVAVVTSRSSADAQKSRLSLIKEGASSDEIAEANAGLAEARASRETNVASARERLNTILAQPRYEDVSAARAKVDQARAEYRRSLDMTSKSELTAPFTGIVADVPVEQGQSISPGQKLVVLHEMTKPLVEVETDEENLSALTIGQQAVITADAFPGRELHAVVTDLGSKVNSERGTVQVLLSLTQSAAWLRPDLTVDVNIVTKRSARRIILPADTVTRYGGGSAVFVLRGGKALPVPVTPGAVGRDGIVVSGDLKDGERVIRDATNVTANSDVKALGR
ncbi:MAG: efflux RND transporter periplasmic adaptor subunit [Armatimonadota bacterium]|nr:efflux RND transporter periplasmic adaptor subunit [bacterium]